MGYQLIKAAVNSDKKSLFFLFNCELLVSLEELWDAGYFPEERLKDLHYPREFQFEVSHAAVLVAAPYRCGSRHRLRSFTASVLRFVIVGLHQRTVSAAMDSSPRCRLMAS